MCVEIVYVPLPAPPRLLNTLPVRHDGAFTKLVTVVVLLQRDPSTSPTNKAHKKLFSLRCKTYIVLFFTLINPAGVSVLLPTLLFDDDTYLIVICHVYNYGDPYIKYHLIPLSVPQIMF